MLEFDHDGDGRWEASSIMQDDDGVPFYYRIEVCDDGTFDVCYSDIELVRKGVSTFLMFVAAATYCQGVENVNVDLARLERKD